MKRGVCECNQGNICFSYSCVSETIMYMSVTFYHFLHLIDNFVDYFLSSIVHISVILFRLIRIYFF